MSRYFISAACGWITSLSYKLLFNLLHTAAKWQQGCQPNVFPFLFSIRGVLQHSVWGFSVLVSTFLSKRLQCANSFSHREARVFITKHREESAARRIHLLPPATWRQQGHPGHFDTSEEKQTWSLFAWLMCLSKDENAIITPTGYCSSFTHRCRSSMSLSNVWIEQKMGGMEDVSTGDPRLKSYWLIFRKRLWFGLNIHNMKPAQWETF